MDYYINKKVSYSFEEAKVKVTELLKEQGFGILTEIDVKATLKQKIDVDFKKYVILGACNPHFAHQALQIEDMLGVLLPCNVIIIEQEDGSVDVSAMDPANTMKMIDNPKLHEFAEQVNERFNIVFEKL